MLVDELELAPQRFWCLHVNEFRAMEMSLGTITGPVTSQIESLYKNLARRFKAEHLQAIEATPAQLTWIRRTFLPQTTVVTWLMQNSGLSAEEAAQVIEGFPIPTAPRLCQIAMNPRRFLGMAAAIAKNPEVIVYSTSGMDASGIKQIHKYAPAHYPDGCLIHISYFPVNRSDLCPQAAECVVMERL